MTLWMFLDNIIVWAPSILHFKCLGMRNLHYVMRIHQKSHNKVTKTVYVWFEFLWIRCYIDLLKHLHFYIVMCIANTIACTVQFHCKYLQCSISSQSRNWYLLYSLHYSQSYECCLCRISKLIDKYTVPSKKFYKAEEIVSFIGRDAD